MKWRREGRERAEDLEFEQKFKKVKNIKGFIAAINSINCCAFFSIWTIFGYAQI